MICYENICMKRILLTNWKICNQNVLYKQLVTCMSNDSTGASKASI